MKKAAGQASVEFLAALPVLLVLAAFATQALAVGYASVLAGNAAEAAALALAGGGDPHAAARAALPGMVETARAPDRPGRRGAPPPPSANAPPCARTQARVRAEAAVEAP